MSVCLRLDVVSLQFHWENLIINDVILCSIQLQWGASAMSLMSAFAIQVMEDQTVK